MLFDISGTYTPPKKVTRSAIKKRFGRWVRFPFRGWHHPGVNMMNLWGFYKGVERYFLPLSTHWFSPLVQFGTKSLELFLGIRGVTRKAGTKSKRVGTERFGGVCFLWKELENEVDNFGKIGVEHQLEHYRTCYGNVDLGRNEACPNQAKGMEIWQPRIVNLRMDVSQDSNGFQTSLVSDYMQFLWIIFSSCPLETSPCSSCMWEAVKEKERKKQLRVRYRKGCQGCASSMQGVSAEFSKVYY